MRLGIADSKATISKFLQHRLETCQNLIKFDKSLPGFARKSKMEMKVFGKKLSFSCIKKLRTCVLAIQMLFHLHPDVFKSIFDSLSAIFFYKPIQIYIYLCFYLPFIVSIYQPSLFLSINHFCFYLSTFFVSTYLTSVFLSTIFISINHLYFNQPSLLLITIFVSIYPYLLLPIYHRLFLSTDPCFQQPSLFL